MSLLYIDRKTILKALSKKLKEVRPDLMSSEETAYVKNRHIYVRGELILDVKEIAKLTNIKGFLVTMDIGKRFDSLDDNFLISTLEKFVFSQNFI